jgi:uncharacterized protein with PhoU and TrkA domain
MTDVEYEPIAVKAVLAEMKDTAELLVDLSYSAVLLGDRSVAEAVLELEDRMDVLQLKARMSLLMAARSPEDAEALAPVLGVVGAAEKISDAAGDIAKVVIDEVGLPEAMRAALPEAAETLARATVAADSPAAGRTLGDQRLEGRTGARAIAVRRNGTGDGNGNANGDPDAEVNGEWLLNPDGTTGIEAGDAVILRGTETAVADAYELLSGEPLGRREAETPAIADLERAVDSIVTMKNTSELAVDLAYGAALFDSPDVAEEVLALEAEVDALQARFEAWTLRAATRVEDPVVLRGLVRLGSATEVISDAALEISEGVLRGMGTHPVIAAAFEASDETIARLAVAEGSRQDGRSLGETDAGTETGARVIAVRRGGEDDDWVGSPGPETALHAGDRVIVKGSPAAVTAMRSLLGSEEL